MNRNQRGAAAMTTKLTELVDLLKNAPDEIFLQTHDVPDPDAIGAAYGLQ